MSHEVAACSKPTTYQQQNDPDLKNAVRTGLTRPKTRRYVSRVWDDRAQKSRSLTGRLFAFSAQRATIILTHHHLASDHTRAHRDGVLAHAERNEACFD